MSILRFMLFVSLFLSFSCGNKPNSEAANISPPQNVNSNLPVNSNLNPNNSVLSNSNVNSNSNPAIDIDLYKKIEAQQLEDKRKAEEKLKNGGNSTNSNINAPVKSSVPKGH